MSYPYDIKPLAPESVQKAIAYGTSEADRSFVKFPQPNPYFSIGVNLGKVLFTPN